MYKACSLFLVRFLPVENQVILSLLKLLLPQDAAYVFVLVSLLYFCFTVCAPISLLTVGAVLNPYY